MPLFPDLYFFEKPNLVITKPGDATHKMLIVRLWSSSISLEPQHIPLWVGTIHYHTPWRWRSEKDSLNTDASALLVLQNDLAQFPSYLTLPKKEDCSLFCEENILKIMKKNKRDH